MCGEEVRGGVTVDREGAEVAGYICAYTYRSRLTEFNKQTLHPNLIRRDRHLEADQGNAALVKARIGGVIVKLIGGQCGW